MGVETIAAAEPIQARLEKVEAVEWPAAPSLRRGRWLIPHSADSAFAAMNRILGEKKASTGSRSRPGAAPRATSTSLPAR